MNCSTPGFPILHYLLEFAQTHFIESMMPSNYFILRYSHLFLSSVFPSIRVFSNELALCIRWPMYWNFSSALALPMNIQDWFHLGLTGLIPLLSKGLSRVFSSTKVRKQQFFSTQPSLWSNSHISTWLLQEGTLAFSRVEHLCHSLDDEVWPSWWEHGNLQLFKTIHSIRHLFVQQRSMVSILY